MVEAHTFRPRGESLWPAARGRQPDREDLASRMAVFYVCPQRHEFEVTFADDVPVDEVPLVWTCRRHGLDSRQVGYENEPAPPVPYRERARGDDGRTHWDRLLERRSRPELAKLLDERLAELAASRRAGARPTPAPRGTATGRKY